MVLGSTIGLGIKGTLSEPDAWTIAIVTGVISIYVGILKDYFYDTARDISADHRFITARRRDIDSKADQIGVILQSLDGKGFEHATSIVDAALERLLLIPKGIIPLDESGYFDELLAAIGSARSGSRVIAVNSINMLRWTEDPRQRRYLEANIQAVSRGVEIYRVFIVSREIFSEIVSDKVWGTVYLQKYCGIHVYVVWVEHVRDQIELHDDFVLFEDGLMRTALKDYHDPVDPTRVIRGELISDGARIDSCRKAFERLQSNCIDDDTLGRFLAKYEGRDRQSFSVGAADGGLGADPASCPLSASPQPSATRYQSGARSRP